jgi:EAL domain-containing protein (putative c-di-GMP-specific phosphodiesterase class I)
LSYLKKFKVYKVKIDQSFVRDIAEDPDDRAIVSAIISMSHSLGMLTIAEGVETAEQLAYLKARGCSEVQGYYFGRPVPADQFLGLLPKPV